MPQELAPAHRANAVGRGEERAAHHRRVDQLMVKEPNAPARWARRRLAPAWGRIMKSIALSGRSILVVEEEPLLALQIEEQFYRAGARVLGAGKLHEALHLAEHPALAAAVVNLRVGSDSTKRVCNRLAQLGVPFVFHTRYDAAEASQTWPDAPVVSKPANGKAIVDAVAGLVH